MHKTFHKLAIAAILSIGLSSSLMANDDLLAMATNGEVSTNTEAIKLSDTQMSDVKGGAIFLPSTINRYYGSTGTLTNTYSGVGSSYFNTNTRAISSPVTTKSAIYATAFRNYYWGR